MAQLGEFSITNVAWVRVRLGVMWVEFVAGSRLASGVFLSSFPLSTKLNISNFKFDQH